MVLARLDGLSAVALRDLTERAWRLVAPKKLLRGAAGANPPGA
jgi:hypothetical protein